MNTRTFFIPGALCAAISLATPAHAGFITEQTAALDAIYSQPAFGSTPVEIRFEPGLTIVRPDLLSIDNAVEQNDLFAIAPGSGQTINAFFVDTISWCGGPANAIGCGQLPGHDLYVNSAWAASTFAADFATWGADVLAHEIAHNLGLPHVAGAGTNLMNPSCCADILTVSQADLILANPFIQFDLDGDRFIDIQPWAITDTVAVPAPPIGAPLLVASVLLWFGWRGRTTNNEEH